MPDDLRDIGQLYRAQMSLANTWRNRLDRTTNWAVVITAAVTTWSFTSPQRSHLILLLGMILIYFFMVVEGRRYRYYEVWRGRVRVIEEGYFAVLLDPSMAEKPDWRELLAEDLFRPAHGISPMEAVGRRFKRVYFWIFFVIYMAWIAKLWIHPSRGAGPAEVVGRAGIGPVPGDAIFLWVTGALAVTAFLSLYATRTREAKGRVREEEEKAEGWKE